MSHYKWDHVGSIADQEQCSREMSFLGPWALEIVEMGWGGLTPDEFIIWGVFVYKWNQDDMKYEEVYGSEKLNFSKKKAAKEHLETWYAMNVLADHLMIGTDTR